MKPRHLLLAVFALALTLAAPPARAWTSMSIDDDPLGPYVERVDRAPHELYGRSGSLWFSIEVAAVDQTFSVYDVQTVVYREPGWSAMFLVGVPFERLAMGSRRFADGPRPPAPPPLPPAVPPAGGPTLKPQVAPKLVVPPGSPLPPLKLPAAVASEPIRIPIAVTPALARAVVNAALRRAKLFDPDARIDAMAARARSAATLPELRLRAARITDDGQSLMPTEYDPARVTMTGGTTLWLEARATWRLDRLVFHDEEVALERIRGDREREQGKCRAHALEVLFAWQRALAKAGDINSSREDLLIAELQILETEAELDVLTGGWFTAWRAATQIEVTCDRATVMRCAEVKEPPDGR